MPKQIAITVSRKISGEQVRATVSSTRGMMRRASSSTTAMIAAALPSAIAIRERRAAAAGEHRHQQHHHDDREVLEDQEPEPDLAMRRRWSRRGCRAA